MDIQEEMKVFEQHLTDTGLVEFAGYGFELNECDGYLHEPTLVAWECWLIGSRRAKAQAVPEWICMKDRYPKAGESVLICVNGIRQNTTYFYDYSESKEWFDPVLTGDETEDEYIVMVEDVTHWMPLPQEPAND